MEKENTEAEKENTEVEKENTEGTIKNGQSRESGNIGYIRGRNKNTTQPNICVGHHHTQTNKSTQAGHDPSYKQLEMKTTIG